jgi:hypothetical protein
MEGTGGTRACSKAPACAYRFIYDYDFGDSWRHEISVEEVHPYRQDETYPRCVADERACPPEDCGGVSRLRELSRRDLCPVPSGARRTARVAGGAYDPDRCDLNGINWQLKRLAGSGG